MMPATSTGLLGTASTSISTAYPKTAAAAACRSPSLAASRGARATPATATHRPQPQKIRPTAMALQPSTNGDQASTAKNAAVYSADATEVRSRPLCFSARSGSSSLIGSRFSCLSLLRNTAHSTSAPAIRTAVPTNGPRQEIEPSSAPSSGPTDRPTPRAASYSRIAPDWPPVAAPTITESAVAMKNALPRPQTARSPTSCSIEPAAEHSAVAATISVSPTSTVRFGPNLALAAPVTSIAMTWTPRYDEKSSVTCDGVASRPLAMDSRIGSTRPIPMKAMTAANAVIHTCLGWPLTASSRLEWCSALIADQFLLLGVDEQFGESRQGGFDRSAVGVVHRDEPLAEELLAGGNRLGVEATTLVGDVHEHRPPVGGVRRAPPRAPPRGGGGAGGGGARRGGAGRLPPWVIAGILPRWGPPSALTRRGPPLTSSLSTEPCVRVSVSCGVWRRTWWYSRKTS